MRPLVDLTDHPPAPVLDTRHANPLYLTQRGSIPKQIFHDRNRSRIPTRIGGPARSRCAPVEPDRTASLVRRPGDRHHSGGDVAFPPPPVTRRPPPPRPSSAGAAPPPPSPEP